MGIDITAYRIRTGRFGPGRGYISTGIAEILSSSITGSDIHYRMLAAMALLTFLLKCCVMRQQEGIMQDINTFAGTDQCQLPEYGPYTCSYICKSIYLYIIETFLCPFIYFMKAVICIVLVIVWKDLFPLKIITTMMFKMNLMYFFAHKMIVLLKDV